MSISRRFSTLVAVVLIVLLGGASSGAAAESPADDLSELGNSLMSEISDLVSSHPELRAAVDRVEAMIAAKLQTPVETDAEFNDLRTGALRGIALATSPQVDPPSAELAPLVAHWNSLLTHPEYVRHTDNLAAKIGFSTRESVTGEMLLLMGFWDGFNDFFGGVQDALVGIGIMGEAIVNAAFAWVGVAGRGTAGAQVCAALLPGAPQAWFWCGAVTATGSAGDFIDEMYVARDRGAEGADTFLAGVQRSAGGLWEMLNSPPPVCWQEWCD